MKNLKLAFLCSAVFAGRGFGLVVVGGSAIEFYTEGGYTSGDVDLCVASETQPLTLRVRQELMGMLRGQGGPRSWRVAGGFVDVLGALEKLARTPVRKILAPFGEVALAPVEELLVERVLVARYPQEYAPALECAKKLLASVLRDEVQIDWEEVGRLANLPEYGNWEAVKELTNEQAKALQVRSPYHPDA